MIWAPEITAFGVGGKLLVQYETKQKNTLYHDEATPAQILARLRTLGQEAPLAAPPPAPVGVP